MIFEIDNREPNTIKEYFTGSDTEYYNYTKLKSTVILNLLLADK